MNLLEESTGFLKCKGDVTYTICDMRSDEAKEIEQRIVDAIDNKCDWKLYRKLLDELFLGFKTKQVTIHNRIMTAGKGVMCRLLAGDTTYSGEVNYCALGNYTATSTITEVALGGEQFRKAVSSTAFSTNNFYASTFFTQTEVAMTVFEVGHFIDGTPTKDSGQMWSRIADPETSELPVTKSLTESLTIDYRAILI